MPRVGAVAIATRPFSDIGRCRAVPVSRKMVWESGDFLAQVREHRQTGDVIHLGLEAVFVLQC
jgi:hypothetical protein